MVVYFYEGFDAQLRRIAVKKVKCEKQSKRQRKRNSTDKDLKDLNKFSIKMTTKNSETLKYGTDREGDGSNDITSGGGSRGWINMYMIPVKLTYFMWGCSNGSYPIYLNPFLTSSGISKTEAGFITGLIFAVSSIGM